MSWVDLYLVAADERQMAAALPFLCEIGEDGTVTWKTAGYRHALDILGPIERAGAACGDADVGTAVVVDGRFHANLCCAASLASQVPAAVILDPPPATPARRFA